MNKPKAFYYEDYDTKSDPEWLYHKEDVDSYISTLRTALARAEEQIKERNAMYEGMLERADERAEAAEQQIAEKDKEIERLKDEVDFRNGESGRLVNRINQMSEAWTLTENARVAAESRNCKLEEMLSKVLWGFDVYGEQAQKPSNELVLEARRVLEEGSQP